MSRPPPPGEPPSPPQPQTRKRCFKQRDEGEPPRPSRRRISGEQPHPIRISRFSAGANSSDSDARTLPPHKKNPKFGLAVAEKYSPNGKFLATGYIARGSGYCFSRANEENLNHVNEGYDGDCEDFDDDGDVRKKHIFFDARARAQALRATTTFMTEQMAELKSVVAEHKAKFERQELLFIKQQEAYKVRMAHQKEQREFRKLQSERELVILHTRKLQLERESMTLHKKILSTLMKKEELTTMEKAMKDKLTAIIDGSKGL